MGISPCSNGQGTKKFHGNRSIQSAGSSKMFLPFCKVYKTIENLDQYIAYYNGNYLYSNIIIST